jgi:pyruvate formate-lyase activating enzyme-like uncharacterized protein
MIEKGLNVSTGALADGCALCLMGHKMTLFITGLCPNKCYYCPVSASKMWTDKMYANERPVLCVEDAILEAEESGAVGTAVTGGEPLVVPKRVAEYVRALKEKFGKSHHIHLYSGFPNLSERVARELYESGLDEIRFHIIAAPGVERSIEVASQYPWRVGVEIPALEGVDLRAEAKKAKRAGAQFMILDEYEVNEENSFAAAGLTLQGSNSAILSYPDKRILELMSELREIIPVHYCTVRSKYLIQYRNRLVSSFAAKRIRGELLDDGTVLRAEKGELIRFAPTYKNPVYERL